MTPGQELYGLVLSELAGLDSTDGVLLLDAVKDRDRWDALPGQIQAVFEAWASVFLADESEPE